MTRLRTPHTLAPVLLVMAVVAAGCGGADAGDLSSSASASPSTSGGPAPTAAVSIKGYKFHAGAVTVKAGGSVTFTNQDTDKHTATATDAADQGFFDTGGLVKGRAKTVKFAQAGTYGYYCSYHPFMKGTVTVK